MFSRRESREDDTEARDQSNSAFRPILAELEYEAESIWSGGWSFTSAQAKTDLKLVGVFFLLVFFGAGNTVVNKLVAIPMYNYPTFLNLYGNISFSGVCFAYIIPMIKYGKRITRDQLQLPKRPFAIMGALDCISTMMLVFANVYLSGTLLTLLPQAAIPISMLLSYIFLGTKYRVLQYTGAVIVMIGLMVVLEPEFTGRHEPDYACQAYNVDRDCTLCQLETTQEGCLSHRADDVDNVTRVVSKSLMKALTGAIAGVDDDGSDDDNDDDIDDTFDGIHLCLWSAAEDLTPTGDEGLTVLWSVVLILACIPMTLSSIYKEIALSDEDTELDPIYLNGWIAVFQTMFSAMLVVPAGMAQTPAIPPTDTLQNLWDGFQCLLGHGSVTAGCHPDDMCAHGRAALYFYTALVVNVIYILLTMYVLKYGSANLLYLALTVMVPIGNLAFALPVWPQETRFHVSDILGLGVILAGLVMFRFGDDAHHHHHHHGHETTPPTSAMERDQQRRRPPVSVSVDQISVYMTPQPSVVGLPQETNGATTPAPCFDDDDSNVQLREPLLTPSGSSV